MSDMENPSEIAQELSNLQALRRMSMDVGNNSDPDLLPFSGLSLMAIPAIAPSGDDNEADPSRLLWVPASVHPELEPSAFKNFLEDRVQPMPELPELDLDELVKDPSKVVKKLAEETRQEADEGDMPILPVAPGTGLRRSTKTTYRKAGSLRGDRVPFSKRSSIENAATKGRESLLLDRDSIDNKLTEDRKKDNVRKPSEGKKEKDGFFGGLFGGSKKKGDKDQAGRKSKDLRPATPEPPARKLVADVDYAWTRFPIIEERAIYRMAHLKLANPRRSLQSQVLLSNFMYSYLAKVQAMHPHIQVPVSPQQKKLEEERKRQEAEQAQQLAEQRAVQDGNYNFEYHRSGSQYGDSAAQYGDQAQHDGSVQYVDDAQIYQYDHPEEGHGHGGDGGSGGGGGSGSGSSHRMNGDGYGTDGYARTGAAGHDYYYGDQHASYDDDDDDANDMW
ncbi:hypothetical protein P8C59_008791 [Phyllachora maydis]|uniref:Protein Zds1 C-terminal domain-containing protein n=1 Tax=Phyllachora maydis TaxID=1825666 RepID=A0AAD9MKA8_9PEZI|nr:hypothetical protein P8C59_008791 [Phyllachora maydis]